MMHFVGGCKYLNGISNIHQLKCNLGWKSAIFYKIQRRLRMFPGILLRRFNLTEFRYIGSHYISFKHKT